VSVAKLTDAHCMGVHINLSCYHCITINLYGVRQRHTLTWSNHRFQVVFLMATWGSVAGAALVFGSIMWFAWSKHLLLIPDSNSMARDVN
jgi:hypothetical protein